MIDLTPVQFPVQLLHPLAQQMAEQLYYARLERDLKAVGCNSAYGYPQKEIAECWRPMIASMEQPIRARFIEHVRSAFKARKQKGQMEPRTRDYVAAFNAFQNQLEPSQRIGIAA